MRHRHAVLGPRPGQPDDVLGTDVRGEDRRPNHPPPKIAPGQEVIGGVVLVLRYHPPRHAEQDAEVEGNHQPVQAGHCGTAGLRHGKQRSHGVHFREPKDRSFMLLPVYPTPPTCHLTQMSDTPPGDIAASRAESAPPAGDLVPPPSPGALNVNSLWRHGIEFLLWAGGDSAT